ncbi:mannosyl-3-phosphoglycerate synthase [Chondrinema litorale]|uniref:mannosyl-3-phosphoglycerate synthase n=1 Tax=Chondrinema litorale TaxID=2994555 RepID=UPI002544740D|nr:mannosyl-3-phosphoglycerate synthase [Chondrinema litorale]UZR94809.1 mannosyl-3-phosphoglycerate synthase [Chondrinema litorale]
MKIEISREIERFGPIKIHGVQKVFELDGGLKNAKNDEENNPIIRRIAYDVQHEIQEQMAIVVPVRNEKIKLIEGVLSGIPHHCQVIIVSNSPREPMDRFKLEKDAIEHIGRFMNKKFLIVHQKDVALTRAVEASGYKHLLNKKGEVKNGKAEGMILSTMLAYLCGKKYIGFIDSDNYFPGAVQEYVQEYCAAFHLSNSPYTMARISWHSKPKIVESNLFFAKRGRASEHTNRILNRLISYYTGYGTEIIKTGNAGEHALTMEMAMKLDYSSGYSIEPYHYVNVLEKYGGIIAPPPDDVMKAGVEFYQIESRNPHLHEVKGDQHVKDMSLAAMEVIYQSPICPPLLKANILEDVHNRSLLPVDEDISRSLSYYPALHSADFKKFKEELQNESYAELFTKDLTDYTPEKKDKKVLRETKAAKIKELPNDGQLEVK